MQTPLTPSDETIRLDTLRSLRILDTGAEERFDRLTRIARRLFDVPIALVSLVDANRQWFKSCDGLDASETPRDISFCGHAILGQDIFLINDAAKDPRFHDNPLVRGEPHIRFYAGCPLSFGNGTRLGTLCIIDREAREFEAEDLQLLRDLARMTEQELSAMELATMDELTGVANRRGFSSLGSHAIGLCKRLNLPGCLVYLDLDYFKEINDAHGHCEGDRALIDFSTLLRNTFRESDVVARLGGDEFAVLMTNSDADDVRNALARLETLVSEHNATSGRCFDLEYSVGTACFDCARHDRIEPLIEEADRAMYEQKRSHHASQSAA